MLGEKEAFPFKPMTYCHAAAAVVAELPLLRLQVGASARITALAESWLETGSAGKQQTGDGAVRREHTELHAGNKTGFQIHTLYG